MATTSAPKAAPSHAAGIAAPAKKDLAHPLVIAAIILTPPGTADLDLNTILGYSILMATTSASKAAPSHAAGIAAPAKKDLLRRLSRIRGQVEGIGRMVEQERYCPDILQQFAAVHSAMRSAEKQLLANHLEHCATHAIEQGGEPAARVREEIVNLFHRYAR